MLRLRTNVTASPTMSIRSWSATAATSTTSGPRAPNNVTISSTPTSSPASTPSSTSPTGVRVGLGQVGRCLQVDRRVEHQPGRGDGPEELVRIARGGAPHRGPRLGQKVLDDHLLHVLVARVGGGDGGERLEPLHAGLADA